MSAAAATCTARNPQARAAPLPSGRHPEPFTIANLIKSA
jgi:hypothetical protein